MAGLDYQYGPSVDYYDRFLPYEIPGEIPTYDPALFKTSRMHSYHESFPQQDSGLAELADIRNRLASVSDNDSSYEPPRSPSMAEHILDALIGLGSPWQPPNAWQVGGKAVDPTSLRTAISSLGGINLPEIPEWISRLPAALPGVGTAQALRDVSEQSLDPRYLLLGLFGAGVGKGITKGLSRIAPGEAGMIGRTVPDAMETIAAKVPKGGNVWENAARSTQRVETPGPGYIREDPTTLKQIRARNLKARGAQTSSQDALDQVMQSNYSPEASDLTRWLENAAPEESMIAQQSRPDRFSSFDLSAPEPLPEISGTALGYRVDRQGRRRVIPDEPIKGEYSQYTGPTKNTEGFWETVSSPGRRAYDFLNNDAAEVVNALLRSPGAITQQAKEVASGLGYGLKEGGRLALQDALQSESPILHRLADTAQGATKWGRRAGLLDEEPLYYVPKKEGGWVQGNWSDAMTPETRSIYSAAPKDSLTRKLTALRERDLPAYSDFIDRHPFATIGAGTLAGASWVADKLARLIGGEPEPMQTKLSDILPASTPGKPPWYSNYDFLWGG